MGRRRYRNPLLQKIGAIVVLLILAGMGMYLVVGTPVVSAKDVQTLTALTAAGSNANATDITEEDGWLTFSLGADAAILTIEYEQEWADVKGSFTHVVIDLSKLDFAAVWKIAKIYIGDGSTEVYLGTISYDEYEKEYKFEVDSDDVKSLDDLKPVYVIIKIYDENGNLVDAVKAGVEQEIKADLVITSEEGTIWSYFIAAFMAFIAALRKVVQGLTAGLTAFFIAVTTNMALLVIFGTLGVMFLWWWVSSGKARKILR